MSDQYDDELIVDEQYDESTPDEAEDEVIVESDESAADEVVQEKKPTRFDKRIGELTWKAKSAEEAAANLQAQNQELAQRLIDAESRLGEVHKVQSSEKVAQLKQEKIDALEIGDFNRVSEIDDALFEAKIAERTHQQPAPPEPKQEQRPVQPQKTQAQADWEARNEAVINDPDKQAKANRILARLVNEAGVAPDDPKIWTLLDKNLNRTKPPAQAGNGMGGSDSGGSVAGLNRADFEHMKSLGYDPKNKTFQEQYLRAKRSAHGN